MAVRLFEGKVHAAAYLQYRVRHHELISKIVDFMKKKVSVFKFSAFQQAATYSCVVVLCYLAHDTLNKS